MDKKIFDDKKSHNHRFKKLKNIPLFWKVIIIITSLITLFLVCSIFSSSFADWYCTGIFRYISYGMAHISDACMFSVGEVMIYIGIFLVIFLLIVIAVGFIKHPNCKKIKKYYIRVFVSVLLFVYVIETLNCFILYQVQTLEESFLKQGATYDLITVDSLKALYQDTVKNLNALSSEFNRDHDGYIVLTKLEQKEYQIKCQEALRNISKEFELLSGYYPNVKMIHSSNFMTQQSLLGVYFPFSMESNYNKRAYITNMPATYCHELSHLKGYILEDEANFLAYIACIRSEDKFIKYCGYLSVLGYMERNLKPSLTKEDIAKMELPNQQVYKDCIFVKKEDLDKIEKNAVIPTNIINNVTETFLDINLKANGVKDGVISYSKVIQLILLYEQLYP